MEAFGVRSFEVRLVAQATFGHCVFMLVALIVTPQISKKRDAANTFRKIIALFGGCAHGTLDLKQAIFAIITHQPRHGLLPRQLKAVMSMAR